MNKTIYKENNIIIKTDNDLNEIMNYKNNKFFFNSKEKKKLKNIISKIIKENNNKNKIIEYIIYKKDFIDTYLNYYYDFGIVYEDNDIFLAQSIEYNKKDNI